jgi:hypothetical protein
LDINIFFGTNLFLIFSHRFLYDKKDLFAGAAPIALVSTMTASTLNHPFDLLMQIDNNLVLYNSLATPLWSSFTMSSSYSGSYLKMEDNGNANIYDSTNMLRWSSNTAKSIKKMLFKTLSIFKNLKRKPLNL